LKRNLQGSFFVVRGWVMGVG